MHPPHFSILREVFSYIARFLPSKRYYLFLFIEHPLIFLSCFKSTGLWRFHFLPFTMPQASLFDSLKVLSIFPSWLFHWNILVFFLSPSDSWRFSIFPSASGCHVHLWSIPCTNRNFSWVLSFSLSLFTMPSACVLLNNPACTGPLEGFYFFSFISPMLCDHSALRGRVQYP